MIAFLTAGYSRVRNLPFSLKGESAEKKLRFTLLIAGVASTTSGIYMALLNAHSRSPAIPSLYYLGVALGLYICAVAFHGKLQRHLAIVTHALLFIITALLLLDNDHPAVKPSACNYLIALTIGSALVLRQQPRYLSKIFPLICLACYLIFTLTGLTWQQGSFHFTLPAEASFYIVNCIVPMISLLLTALTFRGDYSETDLIKRELSAAIAQEQLELYFQPQVDAGKHLTGFEALLRWKHPVKGFISPDIFIPVAEKSGLMIEIGHWVMERTLQHIAAWERLRHAGELVFSVNISPLQLMHRDFTAETLLLLSRYRIQPQRLKFEITESTFIYDQQHIGDVIAHFSHLGVKWAIDDFGVGYSSLKSLSDFSIDDIKIDKSLIMHIFDNESAAIVVHKTIELTREMGLNVLAEGVESEEMFHYLRSRGCQFFQGYHFARPLPAAEVVSWVKKYQGEKRGRGATRPY